MTTVAMRENAAAALCLSYWSGAPTPGCVWMIEPVSRQYVLVKMYRRDSYAKCVSVERMGTGGRMVQGDRAALPCVSAHYDRHLTPKNDTAAYLALAAA